MKICLCMIVRDESKVIERCLESVPFIDYICVADTGSRDNTIQEIERVWHNMGRERAHMQLWKDEWVDFSTNRNNVLKRAKVLLNEDDFIFVMDADDVFQLTECVSPEQVKKTLENCVDVDVVTCRYELDNIKWRRNTFWRAGVDIQYEGKAHEVAVWKAAYSAVIFDAPFRIECNVDGEFQGKDHFLAVAALLEKEPQDPRSVFYLAQSYQCAGELEKAHEAYMRHVQMEGWGQERYVAWVELGKMTDDPGCYMRAMKEDAGRPEAWYYIAKWYHRMQLTRMAIESAQHGYWCAVDHMIKSRALFLDTTIRDKLTELKIIIIQDRYAAHLIVNTAGAEYSQELLDLAKTYVPPKPTVSMVKTQEG